MDRHVFFMNRGVVLCALILSFIFYVGVDLEEGIFFSFNSFNFFLAKRQLNCRLRLSLSLSTRRHTFPFKTRGSYGRRILKTGTTNESSATPTYNPQKTNQTNHVWTRIQRQKGIDPLLWTRKGPDTHHPSHRHRYPGHRPWQPIGILQLGYPRRIEEE